MIGTQGHITAFIDRDSEGCPCVFFHRVKRGKHVRYLTTEEITEYLKVNSFVDLEER
jgi:hypothetical protein